MLCDGSAHSEEICRRLGDVWTGWESNREVEGLVRSSVFGSMQIRQVLHSTGIIDMFSHRKSKQVDRKMK